MKRLVLSSAVCAAMLAGFDARAEPAAIGGNLPSISLAATVNGTAPAAKPGESATGSSSAPAPAVINAEGNETSGKTGPAVAAQDSKVSNDSGPAAKAAEEPAAKPAPPPPPAITMHVDINLSSQRMTVKENGAVKHTWAISSGLQDYPTPRGSFRPQWTAKMWYSRKYDLAPMPHAVFFSGGAAIHATNSTGMLGRPASHGCVRLAPGNAATFYKLVHKHGLKHARIVVRGSPKFRETPVASRRAPAPRELRSVRVAQPVAVGAMPRAQYYGTRGTTVYYPPQARTYVQRYDGGQRYVLVQRPAPVMGYAQVRQRHVEAPRNYYPASQRPVRRYYRVYQQSDSLFD